MPVDGVYLALHGAMAVRDVPRPEAEIARRFREVVGADVPIAGSFDLHGNEDEEFLRWADFAFVTKRYPHYDARLQGERAARALVRTMRGQYLPTTATRKPGIITATVLQWTGQSPSMDIMERARRWEARQKDAYVSVFYGYPWSDVPDVGATVQVMTNDDQELADRIADDMNEFIWRVREDFAVGGYPTPVEAAGIVASAMAAVASDYIVTLPCDSPLLVNDYVARFILSHEQTNAPIHVAFDGKRLQPVHALIKVDLRPSLLEFLDSGDRKIDRWYASHGFVQTDFSDCADMFRNINTPTDQQQLQARQ